MKLMRLREKMPSKKKFAKLKQPATMQNNSCSFFFPHHANIPRYFSHISDVYLGLSRIFFSSRTGSSVLHFFLRLLAYGNSEITSRKEENIEANSLPKVIFSFRFFFQAIFSAYIPCVHVAAIVILLCTVRDQVSIRKQQANDPTSFYLHASWNHEDEAETYRVSNGSMRDIFILKVFES